MWNAHWHESDQWLPEADIAYKDFWGCWEMFYISTAVAVT